MWERKGRYDSLDCHRLSAAASASLKRGGERRDTKGGAFLYLRECADHRGALRPQPEPHFAEFSFSFLFLWRGEKKSFYNQFLIGLTLAIHSWPQFYINIYI